MREIPYVFSAFANAPTSAIRGQTCDKINIFADAERTHVYAKAYVTPQSFSNCASPTAALHNGTFFHDLYQPYVSLNPCCTEVDV